MLFLLSALCSCWVDEMMAIATNLGFINHESATSLNLLVLFQYSGDNFSRVEESGYWTYATAREPYNLRTFDHWHFSRKPHVVGLKQYQLHANEDDLVHIFSNLKKNLLSGVVKKSWSLSFSLKTMLSTICDAHSIFHATELFSPDFPEGDNNARKFMIKYKGQTISLFDFWESGCEQYSNEPFSWVHMPLKAKSIQEFYPNSTYSKALNVFEIIKETRELTIKYGYGDLKPGDELSNEYIAKCREITQQQMAKAGYAIESMFKWIDLPTFTNEKGEKIAVPKDHFLTKAGWIVFYLLLPLAFYYVFSAHMAIQKKVKSE